ncbi:MAG: winged helix-turn-helix domain-containing protein [Thermoleophilaceae bacterium]|jgi:DNA-binding response OmpR family regulator|nr:response regulator transcription factor [Thermoleophilaceae bacterium]
MPDAWVYTTEEERAGEVVEALAELGFTPRCSDAAGALVPEAGGEAARRPVVTLVVGGGAGEGTATLELCRRLRADEELGDVPLVVAVDAEQLEKVGDLPEADELLVGFGNPFELGVRIARARRVVNRVEDDLVRSGSLELNLATYQASINGTRVDFAFMEYELLRFLMTHPGRVFSREALLTRVWGYDYYGGIRTVDVHVRRVRAKLGQEYAARLKTVRGVGYRFEG